jgi:hypothetical protein
MRTRDSGEPAPRKANAARSCPRGTDQQRQGPHINATPPESSGFSRKLSQRRSRVFHDVRARRGNAAERGEQTPPTRAPWPAIVVPGAQRCLVNSRPPMFYAVVGFAAANVGRVGHDADGSSGDFLGACGIDAGAAGGGTGPGRAPSSAARSARSSAARSGMARAAPLPEPRSAPPPAPSLPLKRSAATAAITGGTAAATTATRTAPGCRSSPVIATTEQRPATHRPAPR